VRPVVYLFIMFLLFFIFILLVILVIFVFLLFFVFILLRITTEAARVFAQSCVELVKTLSDIAYRVPMRFLPEGDGPDAMKAVLCV